jgi:D-aspartate ligase
MALDVKVQSYGANIIPKRNRSQTEQIPVLVLGASVTGIGVARVFGRSRIPLYTICSGSELLGKSRWYRPVKGFEKKPPDASNLREFLEALDIPTAVLMPCADDWAVSVSQLSGELGERFPSTISPFSVLDTFTDKWRFATMLQKERLPHPSTCLLQSLSQMDLLAEDAYRGRFLKPCGSLAFVRRHGVKAFFISSKAEALKIMQHAPADDFPILLQEYVPGPATNHIFIDGYVDRNGEIRALLARRRLRMYPALFGNSTLMETIPLFEVEGAVATIRKMFRRIEFVGVFSAEFKLDSRDQVFRILEVNARPWWFVEFAARCGIDVCMLAYREALGLPIQTMESYPIGRRCVYLTQDFKAFHREHPGVANLGAWVKSWYGADEAIFSLDDPAPAIAYCGRLIRAGFHRSAEGR